MAGRSPSRRETSSSAAASGLANGAGGSRDLKDNFAPRFENTTTSYKEWRRRVLLYARKLEIQGRKTEVALNVLSVLEGSSWTQCEDLDLKELESDEGLNILLKRLGRQWSFDDRVTTGSRCRTTLRHSSANPPGIHHRVPPSAAPGDQAQGRPPRRGDGMDDAQASRSDSRAGTNGSDPDRVGLDLGRCRAVPVVRTGLPAGSCSSSPPPTAAATSMEKAPRRSHDLG